MSWLFRAVRSDGPWALDGVDGFRERLRRDVAFYYDLPAPEGVGERSGVGRSSKGAPSGGGRGG